MLIRLLSPVWHVIPINMGIARLLWEGAVAMERKSDGSRKVTRAKDAIIYLVLGVSKLRGSNLAPPNLITASKLLLRCWTNPSQQRKNYIFVLLFFSYRATSSVQLSRVYCVIFFWPWCFCGVHICMLTINSFFVTEQQKGGNSPLLFHFLSLVMGTQSWAICEPACLQPQEEAEGMV